MAPRRGRCRRQDRGRGGNPCRPAGAFLRRCDRRIGAQGAPEPPRGRHGLPAAHRPRCAGTLPHDRRVRDHRRGLHHLRLAPGAGRRLGDRRQGAAHAPRDRTDHDRRAAARRTVARRVRKAPLSRPPPDREKGRRGTDRRFLYLQPVGALDHLQGAVPRGKPRRFLSRPHEQIVREPGRDLPPALFHQHLPAMVAGPALPLPRPQWRDQHDPRQQELDEEPRDQDGQPRLRRA